MTVMVLIAAEFGVPPELEARWLAQLPPERRAQISRWTDPQARGFSLIGSRLLAHGLRRLGFAGDVLATLRYPAQGRPEVALPVDFSVSHCEGRIVCALSREGPVGIDVEALGDARAADFRLYLSAAERAWAGRSTRRFYEIWTRKEAVVKAASARGLRDVVQVDTMAGECLASFHDQRWHTLRVPVGRRHMAHVASTQAQRNLVIYRLGRSVLERDTQVAGCAAVR